MLQLFGRGQSRSFRALWALHEAAVAFDYVEVDAEMAASAMYLALNPQGKVPTLTDGTLTLTESAAMVNYAATLGGTALVPVDARARAAYDDLCYFVMTDFEQPLWTIGKHRFALPEAQRKEAILDTAAWEFQKSQTALLTRLGGRTHAVGEAFTMADVLLAHTINWAERFQMTVDPELLAYRDHHYGRAACVASLAAVGA